MQTHHFNDDDTVHKRIVANNNRH